jgi:pimeloyl-ACP methyl ester carboxylesterase
VYGTGTAWNFDTLNSLNIRQLSRGRLFSTVRGQGPVVLFVHGGFHGAWCWAPFLAYFGARNIPVAALDLAGHGGLEQSAQFIKTGVAEMAKDILEAAAELRGQIILAGHSLGALAAMAAAKQVQPQGLVLLAPAPPANITDLKLLPPFPDDHPVAPPPVARARKWFLSGYSGGEIDDYLARLCPESPAFLNDLYRRNISVDPGWVRGPTLCISGGADDTALHPAGQDEAVAAFFSAELRTLPYAGHCFMLDDARENAAALILGWLQQHDLAGRF